MRIFFMGSACSLWLALSYVTRAHAGGGDAGAPAEPAMPTTVVKKGEDCQRLLRRVYGQVSGVHAHFHAANPALRTSTHVLRPGAIVNIPLLGGAAGPGGERKEARRDAGPARFLSVGPAVRTRSRGAEWTEALPDQMIEPRMRIETSRQGGAEIYLRDGAYLQLQPDTLLIISRLPRRADAGEVELVSGALRARLPAGYEGPSLLVATRAGRLRLRGDARVEAEGERVGLSVFDGGATARAEGGEVTVPAGQGIWIERGRQPAAPESLPGAPAFTHGGPLLSLALEKMGAPSLEEPRGAISVAFASVPRAARYLVEIAADRRFSQRHFAGEVAAPPFTTSLPPGTYYMRVSAMDASRALGPPSRLRRIRVLRLRSDASVAMNKGERADGVSPVLTAPGSATIEVPAVRPPLSVFIDGERAGSVTADQRFHLGRGDHRVMLVSEGSSAQLLVLVSTSEAPAQAGALAVSPLDLPAPLTSPGFPARTLLPRTRAHGLFGLGSSSHDRRLDVVRVDLGGEMALLGNRLSLDVNLPILYHDNPVWGGIAVGDLGLGFRALAWSAWKGRLLLGPSFRLLLPTGTFYRKEAPGSLPAVLDPAALAVLGLGRVGLMTSQGPTAVLLLPGAKLRWSMSYAIEVRILRVTVLAGLDAALGLTRDTSHAAALNGGARVDLPAAWRLILGVRGGLLRGGEDVFGRYQVTVGAEWVR